ncbi:MAG: sigma-70 family RNA polymerase sigma factor [Rhodothermaceae bacterium]|nr:sigma-70 family RNA polymerase sigma factor [Rhodothermaceae bacterium]
MATHDITGVLHDAASGNDAATERLWPLVYEELHRIAQRELGGERPGHTLSPTGLVHEAYFKLVDPARVAWRSRTHFYAVSCKAMRQILVDHARRRNAEKRQTRRRQVTLDEALAVAATDAEGLLAVDEALNHLEAFNERLGRVVECRFFGGLSVQETAEVLGSSVRTVERDWRRAKAYLYRLLHDDG